MLSIHILAAILLAASLPVFTLADWLEDQSNSTVSYQRVHERDLTSSEMAVLDSLNNDTEAHLIKRGDLRPRICGPRTWRSTVLVGNGNPHQNYYYQQITGDINCPAGTISYTTSTAKGWIASVGGAYSFITGGFSVTETYTRGETEAVACGPSDNQVCIYQKIAFTAYTVQPRICSTNYCILTCHNHGEPITFFAPNSNQYGGCFYKGTNNRIGCKNEISGCPGLHKGFWKKCGAAGGSPGHIVCHTFQTKDCWKKCR